MALAARLPTFCTVSWAEPESPGFFTVRLNSVSQALLTLVSVDPPPVDRQAPAPPVLVLLNTSVPVANLLVGLVVSAVKLASVAAAVKPHSAITTPAVIRIRSFLIAVPV